MKYPDNIRDVSQLHPDYLGFIFHPGSPRHCLDAGNELLGSVMGNARPVMVSVNMAEDQLMKIVNERGFRIVQLHGNESPELCGRLRKAGLEVWKAVAIQNGVSPFISTAQYEDIVDMFLFDTATPSHGGSGKKFDWEILNDYNGSTPFMLSGGISPGDATEITGLSHPMLAGIDLNSRFEIRPGLKDTSLLFQFLSTLKK